MKTIIYLQLQDNAFKPAPNDPLSGCRVLLYVDDCLIYVTVAYIPADSITFILYTFKIPSVETCSCKLIYEFYSILQENI